MLLSLLKVDIDPVKITDIIVVYLFIARSSRVTHINIDPVEIVDGLVVFFLLTVREELAFASPPVDCVDALPLPQQGVVAGECDIVTHLHQRGQLQRDNLDPRTPGRRSESPGNLLLLFLAIGITRKQILDRLFTTEITGVYC